MGTITIKQALEIIERDLGNISVPRVLNEQIGIPIDNAINNLRFCIDAINRKEQEENQEEPDIQVEGAESDE